MQLKQLLNDDDAVSPVIGVILMVAITVILAAVIGTFVLGLGDQVQQTAPNAQIAFDYTHDSADDNQELQITHEGGESVQESQVAVRASPSGNETADLCSGVDITYNGNGEAWSDELSAGSTCVITGQTADSAGTVDSVFSSSQPLADATVRVTWESQDGSTSSTLKEWERS